MTETWLRPHDTYACIADISPPGYTFHHRPRPVGRGGGVGFLISKLFNVTPSPPPRTPARTIPHLNLFVLTYLIRASVGFSFVCIALQVIQLTSLKNSRIFCKMLQPCTHNFTLWAILIFTWIHHLQQLPRLMISWHHLTQNNMSISKHTYMDIGLTS